MSKILNIKNKILNSGFTLVELLIVIALLGAIALVVIAAINPVEQSNRARDTQFKADGAQLISAIDRYFAANQKFPWVAVPNSTYDNDAAFGFITASSQYVGICGADCTKANPGLLISSDELKAEFEDRNFVQAGNGADNFKKLFVGKPEGTSQSVYVCYIPAARANRGKAVADQKVYTINATTGEKTQTAACDAVDANWVTNLCYVCIPE